MDFVLAGMRRAGSVVEHPWGRVGLGSEDDTRATHGARGLGRGTTTFLTGLDGAMQAYGWFGTRSLGYVPAAVHVGRPR